MVEDRVDELEKLFNEESHCEMTHKDSTCTAEVTHVAVDCRRTFLICDTAFKIVTKMIQQGGACTHCKKMTSSCWKVVPV